MNLQLQQLCSQLLLTLCLMASCLFSATSYAAAADFIQLTNLNDLDLGTWSPTDGSIVTQVDFCVGSANNNAPAPNSPAASTMPYDIKLYANDGFTLNYNGWSGQTGERNLALSIQHQNLDANTPLELLSNNTFSTTHHTGQFNGCPNGNNARLRITIDSEAISNTMAGNYFSTFTLTARGGSSGNQTATQQIRIDLNIPTLVNIDRLDDLSLPNYGGSGDLSGTEYFCVYSNQRWSGHYTLTITGTHTANDTEQFYLLSNKGVLLPYQVRFNSRPTPSGTLIRNGVTSGSFYPNSFGKVDCDGSDNAALTVVVRWADISTAENGIYHDTITILVAPGPNQ